jgi:hypothetical protein
MLEVSACSGAPPGAPARRCAGAPAPRRQRRRRTTRLRKPRASISAASKHGGFQQHLARRQLARLRRCHQLRLARRHRETQLGNGRAKAGRLRRPRGCRSSWRSPCPRPCSGPRSARRWARRSPAWPQAAPDVVFVKVAQRLFLEAETPGIRRCRRRRRSARPPPHHHAAQSLALACNALQTPTAAGATWRATWR